MKKAILSCVSLAAFCLATSAQAQQPADPSLNTSTTSPLIDMAPGPKTADVDAEYRIWGQGVDRPDFDDATDDELEGSLYQRVQVAGGVEFGSLRLRLDVQALTGELTGDGYPELPDERINNRTNPRGTVTNDTENLVDLYEAYVAYNLGVAEIRAGVQRSDFGMGLVANGGQERPWDLFNQQFGGDRSIRVLMATAPGAFFSKRRAARKIFFAVGGDLVYRDDNADLLEGDTAWQAVSSVFYQDSDPNNPANNTFLGIYFAYRNQEDRDTAGQVVPDELEVFAFDLSGRKAFTTDDDQFWIKFAAESALLIGESTRAYSNEDLEPETDLLAAGAAADFQATWKPHDLSFRLLSGYASGDANPDDDTLFRFRFDPNYKVGVVLYDHYLPATTQVAFNRVNDPERSGEPPKGVWGLVNDGAIENTFYLNPQFLLGNPDGLLTGVGLLAAWSAEPLADPYNSFANGGTPTGINGRDEASRQLGIEVDVAAQYPLRIWKHLVLESKVEYGIFFPGSAFEDELGNSGSAASVIRGRVALQW